MNILSDLNLLMNVLEQSKEALILADKYIEEQEHTSYAADDEIIDKVYLAKEAVCKLLK